MGGNYYYFCAQLPTLVPGNVPPMSLEDFDSRLEFLPESDAQYIRNSGFPPSRNGNYAPNSAAGRFRNFEFALRGELARCRGGVNLPPETDSVGGLREQVAQAAQASDPLERERRLDLLRWRMLDDLEREMFFSAEAVVCYRLKLSLMLKAQQFQEAAGRENFRKAVDAIDKNSAE